MLTTMLHQMHVRCLQGAKNRTETQDSCFCRHVEAQRNNLAPNRWRTTGCQATRQSIRFIFRNHARSVLPGEIRRYQHIKSMNSWEFILNNIKIFPAVEVKKKKRSAAETFPRLTRKSITETEPRTRNLWCCSHAAWPCSLCSLVKRRSMWPSGGRHQFGMWPLHRIQHAPAIRTGTAWKKRGAVRNSCPQTAPVNTSAVTSRH